MNGERVGKLNACFMEFYSEYPTHDETWTPGENIFIMSSDYDESGQYYLNPNVNPTNEVLYKVRLIMKAHTRVQPGDKYLFSREFSATSEDKWIFQPTNVKTAPDIARQKSFALFQNYPNPFNANTTIKFFIDKPSKISLKIFNSLGQEIAMLLEKDFPSGEFSASWDGRNHKGQLMSSGLYFAVLKSEIQSQIIKMLCIH